MSRGSAKIHALYPHHCALQWHCQAYSLLGSSHWQKGWLSLHWFDLNCSLLVVLEKDLGSFQFVSFFVCRLFFGRAGEVVDFPADFSWWLFFWERRCCCWWGVGGKVGRVKWLVFSVANAIVLVPSTKHPKHLVVIFWMYSQDHHSCIWQHLILPSFQRVNLRLAFLWQTLGIFRRYIDIPEPVREVLDLWRPSPLYRATRWGWWQSFHPRNPDFVIFSPKLAGPQIRCADFFFSNVVGDSTWGLMCPWQVGESFKLAKGCEDLLQIWRWITFGFT